MLMEIVMLIVFNVCNELINVINQFNEPTPECNDYNKPDVRLDQIYHFSTERGALNTSK